MGRRMAAVGVVLMVLAVGAGCAGSPQVRSISGPPGLEGDAYYLSECAMCWGMLGGKGDTVDREVEGRDVRFCCARCADEFESRRTFGAVDRRMAEDQRPLYPLRVSVVSGKALGRSRVEVILGNRLFVLAEESEVAALEREAPRCFRLLDEAVIEAQSPGYGMKTKCPVQGDILESDTPIDIVIANRMIRLCCYRCVRVVRARPSQYLGMVDYANRAARGGIDSE
ncbi:MAG: hypothetical protein KF678_00825 [Phycisphaeraceae bacterium]|nr:hypothetical protein [Phycisphaeraceae bacterium]